MSPSDNRMRARAKVDSAAHVAAAKVSNKESADHVDASRDAIERSLRLLTTRFHHGFEID